MRDMPVFEIERVRKAYDGHLAVDDLSLTGVGQPRHGGSDTAMLLSVVLISMLEVNLLSYGVIVMRVLSIVLLLISIYMALLVSSRIYRVGILMYGKKPTIREIARWLRYA